MKFKWNNKYFKTGLTALIVICLSILFFYLLFYGSRFKNVLDLIYEIMMPVFFGVIMAYLLSPMLNLIEQRILYPLSAKLKIKDKMSIKKIVRGIGILLTALFFYFIIQIIVSMLLSQIIPSIRSIVDNSDNYYKTFIKWLDNILSDNPRLRDYVYDLLEKYSLDFTTFLNDVVIVKATELIKTVSLSVISVFNVFWNFILGFIISIYLLISKEKFANQAKKITYAFMNTESANVFINNVRFTHNTFIGFISGKIVDSLIIGILCFIGTSILKTPYAALVSVIVGITNVIPFFGPFIGAIPTGILVLVVDPMHPLNCVYYLLFILFLQQLDGNFIGPKILGDSTGLSSFWVIFAITVFGGIFDVTGMIIGVPTFAVIYAMIKSQVYTNLLKKKMPTETDAFENLECVDRDGFRFSNVALSRKIRKNKAVNNEDTDYRSGSQFISSLTEWNVKYYKIDPYSQGKEEEETEDEVCDSES